MLTQKTQKQPIKTIIPWDRVIEAFIKKLEGGAEDPQRKYDYLTKLTPETVKSLAHLSEQQLNSMAECHFLGKHFPSLKPLADLALELAYWSPSKQGKRAEQLTATMLSRQDLQVIPYAMGQTTQDRKGKKPKEVKD